VDGIHPGDFSLVDQYLDFTKGGRRSSFFGEGLVGHVSMAQPVCQSLSMACLETMEKMNIRVHEGKTYACVEGPRLGTKAESHFLRKSGGDLVGMTHVPEAFLAREAQLCYGALAVVTDYDCWKEDVRESANLDSILKNYGKTIEKVQDIIKGIFLRAKADNFARCSCSQALAGAILTQRDALTEEKRQIYDFLSR
jgi:5'-methylthioadenosine phosphorylase